MYLNSEVALWRLRIAINFLPVDTQTIVFGLQQAADHRLTHAMCLGKRNLNVTQTVFQPFFAAHRIASCMRCDHLIQLIH